MHSPGLRTRQIAGFGLVSPDASRLADFYEAAFGARRLAAGHLSSTQAGKLLGVSDGALRHIVQLGEQAVDILQFDKPGSPYPPTRSPYDTIFQHFAIVVSAMGTGLSRLERTPGWTAISSGGPQRLPQRSGGVTAFKFRDPDGHPLELLEFTDQPLPHPWGECSPNHIFLGIDHSAISVRDTAVSIAFYESLGFSVSAQTLNHGAEQSRLDGVPHPRVEVTALAARGSTPHLELLCYRSGPDPTPPHQALAGNAVAATRIRLAVDGLPDERSTTSRLRIDPDGHHLLLEE